jgi:cephalosporin-C deacetylase-like acetyl esterase
MNRSFLGLWIVMVLVPLVHFTMPAHGFDFFQNLFRGQGQGEEHTSHTETTENEGSNVST